MRLLVQALGLALPLLATANEVAAIPIRAAVVWQDTVPPLDSAGDGQANHLLADGGRVFVSGFLDAMTGSVALFRAYDARTGTLRWQDTIADAQASYEGGRIALADDRLFAVVSTTRPIVATGLDWVVRAYDAVTGEVLWQDDHDEGRVDEAGDVAVADGRVLVAGVITGPGGSESFAVRAYDPASGELLWQHQEPEHGNDVARSVLGADGRVFVGGSASTHWLVQALDASSGAPQWSDASTEEEAFGAVATVADVATAGSRVFAAGTIAGHGVIRAYDAATGTLLWERRELAAEGDGLALVVSGARVYAGSRLRNRMLLQALDARTGEVVWQRPDDEVGSRLDLVGSMLVAAGGASSPAVNAYDTRNGALRWVQRVADEGSCLALAHDRALVFAAGTTKGDSFQVRAFTEQFTRRPVEPGRHLPHSSRD